MKTSIFIIALLIANFAFAEVTYYQPYRGSAEHCKEGLALKTSKTVVGSKYDLGSIEVTRFTVGAAGTKVYHDRYMRITQSRFPDTPLCRSMILRYTFECSWINIENNVINGRYASHPRNEIIPSKEDTFGFHSVPVVEALDLRIWGDRLYFRKFAGLSYFGKEINSEFWVKMLSSPRLEKCVYRKVTR